MVISTRCIIIIFSPHTYPCYPLLIIPSHCMSYSYVLFICLHIQRTFFSILMDSPQFRSLCTTTINTGRSSGPLRLPGNELSPDSVLPQNLTNFDFRVMQLIWPQNPRQDHLFDLGSLQVRSLCAQAQPGLARYLHQCPIL